MEGKIRQMRYPNFGFIGISILNLLLAICSSSFAQTYAATQIFITSGGIPEIRPEIEQILTKVIQEINKRATGNGDLDNIRKYCTYNGFKEISDLVNKNRIFTRRPAFQTQLIDVLPSGSFEVRRITVTLGIENQTLENAIERELVFTLSSGRTDAIKLDGLRYALEKEEINTILENGQTVSELLQRQKILEFLEYVRTAYITKNIAFLDTVYSDDALIIVGRLIKKRPSQIELPTRYDTSQYEIRNTRRTKIDYINNLRNVVFKKNALVDVKFDTSNLKILEHPLQPGKYGVTLKQIWKSTTYPPSGADVGYLFFFIDFSNSNIPLIQVRIWNEVPFDYDPLGRYF